MDGLYALIAHMRAAARVSVLHHDPHLRGAAQTHIGALAQQDRINHVDLQGTTPAERGRQAGYTGHVLGELLAVGPDEDPRSVVSAWHDHGQTRAVLLEPGARHIGLAHTCDGFGQNRWSILLGA
ncbi:CAP domain-containing protein [Gymnodinialimonas sp. 2305UL16-5]|uniref:CAP domain-containing protein n=1 Tax=Gymnodinialimonas mytili TaxID=3126503 RepID=UPI0030ACBE26